MSVNYSKKRMVAQSATKNLKYMAPLAEGTVLNITDVIQDSYKVGEREVINDSLLCVDQDGLSIKVSVADFNRMELKGDKFSGEGDSDVITLPNQIIISGSTPRTYKDRDSDEEITLYPTFSYNDHQKFLDSKGAMEWSELVASGLREDNPFQPVQNYSGEAK